MSDAAEYWVNEDGGGPEPCDVCDGTGLVDGRKCKECDGKGY